jgi:hypothetical protein
VSWLERLRRIEEKSEFLQDRTAKTAKRASCSFCSASPQKSEFSRDGTAADWREVYEERIAVATIDGEHSESEARRIAHDYCVVRWLDLHPLIFAADRCAGCGRADRPGNIVPFGAEPLGHAWLHPRCWADWHASRRAQAIMALAGFGIIKGDET